MNYALGNVLLRRPEPGDLDALYAFKNDPEVAAMLVGFTTGYALQDLREWIEAHRKRSNEVIWTIARAEDNACLGHAGLYDVDQRVRSAELGILIGPPAWGQGIGKKCVAFLLDYGFGELNLNRVWLSVLATNERALRLYQSMGFRQEGVLRQAQFKRDRFIDVIIMSMLRDERAGAAAHPQG